MLLSWFITALAVTGPIYLWLLGGVMLRRLGLIGDDLVNLAAQFSYRMAMPLVLFFGASQVDYSNVLNSRYLIAGVIATITVSVLADVWGRLRAFEPAMRAIFVQGSFRSNLGIVGIALAASAYGDAGLALAALPVAILTILYNIIAVWVLDSGHGHSTRVPVVIFRMASNPLIVGISAGVVVSVLGVDLGTRAYRLGDWFSTAALPLALITIGASLSLKSLRASQALAVDTMLWRHLISPAFTMLLALWMGIYGPELGVLFLLFSSPIAAASFVMVVAVGGNGAVAANLIVLSTLVSGVTTTLGFALLNYFGLV
ncbi:MAG: AEC family transporter [Pseudomonadota bacterium]